MYLDSVYSALDTNSPAIPIYLNKKAFDPVSHRMLFSKNANYGFDSAVHNFLNALLTNRTLFAKTDQNFFSLLSITSGVLQGSVLGPLLLINFVSDMAKDVTNNCFYLFADELKIFSTPSSSLVQENINFLINCCNLNDHHFHPSKCNGVKFGGLDSSRV